MIEEDVRRRAVTPRMLALAAALAVLLVLLVAGATTGRSTPGGNYRPLLPDPVLTTACSPLPDRLDPGFAATMRADRMIRDDTGTEVRRLDLHVDLVDADVARERLTAALVAAGFTAAPALEGEDPEVEQWFTRPDYGRLGFTTADLDVPDGSWVRGTLLIDVPASTLTDEVRAACDDVVQTKRHADLEGES